MARLALNRTQWIGIALAFYAFIAIGISEGGLGVLLPSILRTYKLTPASITLLFISQISGYITAALTSGFLTNRIGLARMLLCASLSLTGALVIYATTGDWWIMVAAGTFLGLGIGWIDAGMNTFIASHQRSANLMGFLHAFYGIGALLGPAIATTLLTIGLNWRRVYWIFAGIVSIVIVSLIWILWVRYQPLTQRTASSRTESGLWQALKTPIVPLMGLLLLLYVGLEASVGNWAFTVQSVSRGTPTWIAGYSITGYWFGLTLGRLSLGSIVQRLGANRAIAASLLLFLFGLFVWWCLPNQLWSLPLMGFALAAIFPTVIWVMPQRVAPALVPAAIGFLTSVGSFGAALIPTGIGWIADRAGLAMIPVLMFPLAIAMLILHYWIVQQLPRRTA